jgi:hypothetical protein
MTIARHLAIAAQILEELSVPLARLPCTADFDEVYLRFNVISGTDRSRHEVWWRQLNARKRAFGRMSRRRSAKS